MKAMILDQPGTRLHLRNVGIPGPGPTEILVKVRACAVCRTDLHVVDGELAARKLPLIPGHEVVGIVEAVGPRVAAPTVGDRVGVPWLARTCGDCAQCRAGRENLCASAEFTGYTRDGGYAEALIADASYPFPIPEPV